MTKHPVSVDIREIKTILTAYLNTDARINYAVKIVGHPGVGKSSIVRQVAEAENRLFIDTRLAFKENVDLGGYPVPHHSDREMVYYRPRFIPPETVPEGKDGIVWFLDEANRAHPTVIQTLFQIITEHVCGEHRLADRTAIVLAGNLGDPDDTVLTDFHDAALDGRLAIFHLKPSVTSWLRWAAVAGIHPAVIRYITVNPDALWDETQVHPNPRGWHQVSQALTLAHRLGDEAALKTALNGPDAAVVEKVVISLVGETAGHDFVMEQVAPRELTAEQILAGDPEKIQALKNEGIHVEDLLWAINGTLGYFRDPDRDTAALSDDDLKRLGYVLTFIAGTRADVRVSFFYLLLKSCGIFSQIPAAVNLLEDAAQQTRIRESYTAFLEGGIA
ncbi:MAG: hypothetical protein CSA22_01760 [Deltaproteobacteria bacterium]|nr:MAG: hypothetical protein CSA22_01760 [Deltaproteobacteria bacterium]